MTACAERQGGCVCVCVNNVYVCVYGDRRFKREGTCTNKDACGDRCVCVEMEGDVLTRRCVCVCVLTRCVCVV